MSLVSTVSASADRSLSELSETQLSISGEDISEAIKNSKVLLDTDNQKIVSYKNDSFDGYIVSWKDDMNQNRTNFAFIEESELKSSKYALSSESIENNEAAVIDVITKSSISFWSGSYIETYSDGVHLYLSETDAERVVGNSAYAVLLAGILADGPGTITDALGLILAAAIENVYWYEQNSDGSLDMWIPYSNIISYPVLGYIKVKIGSHWYKLYTP
jgi:hypothetical protein